MLLAIFQNTPHWVWVLLAALIAVGFRQTLPRRRKLGSATLIPAAMIVLSFYGVISAFPAQPAALLAWTAGVAGALIVSTATGAWNNIRWSAADERLLVPGSWAPLIIFLSLFAVKFGVGASLATQPVLADNAVFAVLAGLAYGGFSGIFLSRALAMWKVAREALQLSMAA